MQKLSLSASVVVLLTSAALPAGAQIVNQERFRVNGYTNFEWEYSPSDVGRGDRNGSFDAQEFDLVFNILPTDRLRLATDLRWEHGVASENFRGNAEVSSAFAEYAVVDALKIRAGKMLTPFGIYNEIHTAKPAIFMYREPWTIAKPDKLGFPHRFFSRAGTGVAALGTAHLGSAEGDYTLMVSNGESMVAEQNQFEQDENSNKSIAGRVRLRPIPSLTLGASYFQDQCNEYDDAGDDTGLRTRLNAVGAQAQFAPGAFLLEGEYIRGKNDPATEAAQVGTGVYGSASYLIAERFRPYVFYQRLDPNADVADDLATVWGPGLNTRIDGGLFLKLEMLRFTSGPNNTRIKGNSYTELNAAVAVAF